MAPTRSSAATSDRSQAQLGLLVPDSTADDWDALRSAAVDAGDQFAIDVSPDAADETDPAAQIRKVEAFGEQQLKCFAIAPVDPAALVGPLAALAKKKVSIFNLGLQMDDEAAAKAGYQITSIIGPSDEEIGHQAAREMITAVAKGSEVAMVLGTDSDPNAALQRKGFTDAADGNLVVSTTKATNDNYNTAVQVVTDTIAAKPSLKGIFASSDVIGRAAAKAVKAAGKADSISVISVGGTIEGLRAVQSGELEATVATFPASVGELVVRACRQVVDGGTVKPRLVTQSYAVNKANVGAELDSYPQPTQPFPDPLV
ncbi:substrate-binding domain-containing protein [Cryptosporangium phraense]|uniref:Sugar ABC transporter substrate-binding protein n=1 Tax=Cryptosporangium phraense TaxID=2593070 RepID=A0A545AZL6_9ACTN|nr:substrate-binding domain-containing protein [Cryptosporangium phraense]TQS46780.1 sugar ABC transporter substrate-binding protein [Cryptosporangium phraense]